MVEICKAVVSADDFFACGDGYFVMCLWAEESPNVQNYARESGPMVFLHSKGKYRHNTTWIALRILLNLHLLQRHNVYIPCNLARYEVNQCH